MWFLILTVLLAIGTYFLWSTKTLIANFREARRTGLPVVVLLFHPLNPFYLLTMPFYRPITERLPFGLSEWKYLHFWWENWAYHTCDAQFEHYGDLIITSSPGGNFLHVGDAGVSSDVMSRRIFPKDMQFYEYVRCFGDSVLTVEGHKWRKHRKIANAPFSEAVHSSTWKTTLGQAKELLQVWASIPSAKVRCDIRCVSRNVLSDVGFGVAMPFTSVNESVFSLSAGGGDKMDDDPQFGTKAPAGHSLPYGQALDWLLDNLTTTLIIPKWMQRLGPSSWRKTAKSYDDTGLYIKELLERERKTNSGVSQKKNLLSALVMTSDSAEKGDGLSEQDIMGNIFVFSVAGFETTAGTLLYALTELAIHQDKQRWLYEELVKVLDGESEDPTEWDYKVIFPKLVAPMCVIHETLRLHPIFHSLPKRSGPTPQKITYKGTTHIIPPETSVFIISTSLHFKRKYWGDSVNEFTPEKWDARRKGPGEGWNLTDPKTGISKPTTTPNEGQRGIAPYCHLRQPYKGSYIPFAEGYRQCLGKNFALVEMSALLGVLFRHHKVEVARREGETREEADERACRTMKDSGGNVAINMNREVELRWVKR